MLFLVWLNVFELVIFLFLMEGVLVFCRFDFLFFFVFVILYFLVDIIWKIYVFYMFINILKIIYNKVIF